MSIKIAGLMPIGGVVTRKSLRQSFGQLCQLVDVPCVLSDNPDDMASSVLFSTTDLTTLSSNLPWDDYTNRLTMLVRATAHGCNWVLWLDSDETLESGVTRDLLNAQIEAAEAQQCVAVTYAVREMWNQSQYRSDGLWCAKRRVILQKNPFMEKHVFWRSEHLQRFHAFPLQDGCSLNVDTQMLHWGMSTPELRVARRDKWNRLDPKREFQDIGYDYMTDTLGLELTELKPTT